VIAAHIEIILLITGAATALAVGQFIAPLRFLRLTYGEAPVDPVSVALARHWGLLIFCVGALLIFAAFHPPIRVPIMVFAMIEKVGFAACVLGTSLRKRRAAAAMAVADLLMAAVYGLYFAGL
jgi:hypothetical protein